MNNPAKLHPKAHFNSQLTEQQQKLMSVLRKDF